MWNWIKRLYGCGEPPPEQYLGEQCGQRVIERYGDFVEVLTWGFTGIDQDGNAVNLGGGKLLRETVKFIGRDGKVKLGTDLVTQKDKRITGFEATEFGADE